MSAPTTIPTGRRPGRAVRALAILAVFSLALWWLHRELARHELGRVLRLARATPWPSILAALGWTAASYGMLTFYDVLALRHVGRALPYPKTLLTSYTAYVASHNLGLAGVGGTAVRFRLYTAWGLSAVEIAEIVAFCALTFWVGFLAFAGTVFVWSPLELPASLHAPIRTTLPLGVLFLLAAVAILVWCIVFRRPIRFRAWRFQPPSPRMLLVQLPLAALDWSFSAAVVHALLPPEAGVGFLQLLGVFLCAQVVGMISHVPGGLGVFETVFLLLLPATVPTPEIAAALLVYRAIYYVLPLALGAVLLLVTELALRREALARLGALIAPWSDLVVPRAIAATTFLGGAVLVLTGSLPAEGARMSWLRDVLPLPVVELSHLLGSLVGTALLVLARGLQRRLDAAWIASIALLAFGIVFSLTRGLDYDEAAFLAPVLGLLLLCRRSFRRRSSLLDLRLRADWLVPVGMVLIGSVWLGLIAYRHVGYSQDLWWQFGYKSDAPRFLRASAGAITLLTLLGLVRLFRVARPRLELPGKEELAAVRAVLAGEPETTGHLALLEDKFLMLADDRSSFVMYGVQDTTWVALGDPVGGSEEERREAIWRFRELVEREGGRAVFYQVGEELLGAYAEAGFTLLKIGEEARIDLASFSLEGSVHKGLRSNLHRVEREGAVFEVVLAPDVAGILEELRGVSDAWLATKNTREKGFSLGFFAPAYLSSGPVAIVRLAGRIVAFANVWQGAPGGELSVDLMRHLSDAPSGLMDFLFVRLFQWGKERGFRWFSLGMAPLAGFEQRETAPLWNRFAGFVFQHGEHFYNFQGLREYKDKFGPRWRPRYLACRGVLALPTVLLDLSTLISGGVKGLVGR